MEVFDRDQINKIFGGTTSEVAGVLTPVADEVLNFATLDTSIKIANQNGDKTKPTITDLRTAALGGGVALAEGTDYEVKPVNGVWYVFPIDGGAITPATNYYLNYSYTPNQSVTNRITLDTTELKNFEVKITSTDPNT